MKKTILKLQQPFILTIGILTINLIFTSCNNLPTPCNCAEAFVNGNFELVSKCEKHFETLNEAQKEKWVKTIYNCDPSEKTTKSSVDTESQELPDHILIMIENINQLNQDYYDIPDSYDMFSIEELATAERKLIILEELINLIEELDNTGYQSYIPEYESFKHGIKLKYSGVKMQLEALKEMKNNGSLR
jgi:hypothetical protein